MFLVVLKRYSSIDTISEEKNYVNDSEIEVEEELQRIIPNCIIKSNR